MAGESLFCITPSGINHELPSMKWEDVKVKFEKYENMEIKTEVSEENFDESGINLNAFNPVVPYKDIDPGQFLPKQEDFESSSCFVSEIKIEEIPPPYGFTKYEVQRAVCPELEQPPVESTSSNARESRRVIKISSDEVGRTGPGSDVPAPVNSRYFERLGIRKVKKPTREPFDPQTIHNIMPLDKSSDAQDKAAVLKRFTSNLIEYLPGGTVRIKKFVCLCLSSTIYRILRSVKGRDGTRERYRYLMQNGPHYLIGRFPPAKRNNSNEHSNSNILKSCEGYVIEEPTTDCVESILNSLSEIARDLLDIVSEEIESDHEIVKENADVLSEVSQEYRNRRKDLTSALDKGVLLNTFLHNAIKEISKAIDSRSETTKMMDVGSDADDLVRKRVQQLLPPNMRFPIGNYKCYSCDGQMNRLADWEDHIFQFLKGRGCYPYPSSKLKEIILDAFWYFYKEGNLYYSSICVFKCPTKKSMLKHIMHKHLTSLIKCAICPAKFVLFSLRNHLSSHDSTALKYKCSYCLYESHSIRLLQTHESRHRPNKHYECQYCDHTFYLKELLKNHLLKCHTSTDRVKRFSCPHCSREFTCKNGMMAHIRRMHFVKDQPYQCHYCLRETWHKDNLAAHIFKNHMKRKMKRPYRCDICEVTYCSKGFLVNHKKTHSQKPERHPCNSCDSVFPNLPSKFIHNNAVHLSRYEYLCNSCKFSAEDRDTFVRHVISKHSITIYCHYCPKTFWDKRRVLKHINFKHNPLFRFKCNECNHFTKSKELLNQHMNVRHNPDAIVYTCYHCGHRNKIKHKLAQHMKTKHNHLLRKKKNCNSTHKY